MSDIEYRFASVTKDPAEERDVKLECFSMCANFWAPNQVYAAGTYVRPTRPTGFAYLTILGGLSGAVEPRWPEALSATKIDGSVEWTCSAPGANGLNAVSSPAASAPTGITATGVAVADSTRILATYNGGTEGQDYDVAFTFTINGRARVGRQTVRVRKR